MGRLGVAAQCPDDTKGTYRRQQDRDAYGYYDLCNFTHSRAPTNEPPSKERSRVVFTGWESPKGLASAANHLGIAKTEMQALFSICPRFLVESVYVESSASLSAS